MGEGGSGGGIKADRQVLPLDLFRKARPGPGNCGGVTSAPRPSPGTRCRCGPQPPTEQPPPTHGPVPPFTRARIRQRRQGAMGVR
eukprot:12604056-Alexandrium_andersonii.AAC.1